MALLDAALRYVGRCGTWPVFPADAKTKRPIIKTGTDHAEGASTDIDVIRDWHRRGMLQAIGMPSGAASGTVIIDADAKYNGEALLAELEEALGPLPRTKTVRTQSGGLHVYLAHPGGGVRVRTGAGPRSALGRLLGGRAGVDVRADGGIVILPPSCGYVWISDGERLPELPKLWLAAINYEESPPPRRPIRHRSSSRISPPERGPTIECGGRSDALYRRGAMLHLSGASDDQVRDDLERMNAARCKPPVGHRELARIVASAVRATGRGGRYAG